MSNRSKNKGKCSFLLSLIMLLSVGCASTKAIKGIGEPQGSDKEEALRLFREGSEVLYDDTARALDLFDRAISIDPNFIAAHFNAGVALESLARLADAAKRYEGCLAIKKTEGPCLENLVLVKAKLNDVEGAVKLADEYMVEFPDELFPKIARAKLWLFQKEYKEAEKLAREVIERDAENVEALYIMAQIFFLNKEYSASKWVLKNALETAPSHGGLYLALGHANMKLDLMADAMDNYALAQKYHPTDEALESYGLLLLKRGRDQEALPIFKKLVELSPEIARNHLHLGNAYVANRDFENAKAAYLRAQELGEDKDVVFNLGLLYLDLKPEGLPELDRWKTSLSYFKAYLEHKDVPEAREKEVQGYIKSLNEKIEALEYVPEPLPDEEKIEPEALPEEKPEHSPVAPAEAHEPEKAEEHEGKEKKKANEEDEFLKN